jgi:hypothetical protein
MQRLWVLFLLLVFALPAMAGDLAKGISQRVIRFNAMSGEDLHAWDFADCYENEDCLISLTRTLNQSGGNPGLLRKGETAVARIVGLRHVFEFAPADGERFCAAVFVKHSAAPSFLSQAPELLFEISASAARIDIQLPENAARSWVDGFLVLYSAKPDAERKCTLSEQTVRYTCKGRCEAKSF